MARPLIGITTYVEPVVHGQIWNEPAVFTPATYVESLIRAGAAPLLLPPSPADPAEVLAAVGGLLLIGGPDVDPALYGAEPHPKTEMPRRDRDEWEIGLVRAAIDRDVPVLAVCRGIQVLNVALGGTLHQHLRDVVGHRQHLIQVGRMNPNAVTVEPGNLLASILPAETKALCHHHQAVDRVADGLTVVARHADGIIEAVVAADRRFVLGVQWHPEEDPDDDRLFTAFVEAVRNPSSGR
ncbi:MAG TPA: gamma-glutamyl-gamma-aminobutyrate hydrolase family protein [Acidimicrobiales bacterium]|jgi:gamma-glutamyl-gamma-aminobutyrate hydrolase PuuD|nr:gamma-glutamyl-gamma-aminobutyrate hydrolase family protein [Acidimicrobiales bacterium]